MSACMLAKVEFNVTLIFGHYYPSQKETMNILIFQTI